MACSLKGMQTVSLGSNANSLQRAHYSKQTEELNTTGNIHMSSGFAASGGSLSDRPEA